MNRRIDIVVKYFLPVTAGIEINILETYRRLVQSSWEVVVHTSKDTYTEKNILPASEEISGIKVHRYQFNWSGFAPDIDYQNTNVVALHNFDLFPHSFLLTKYALWKLLGRKRFAVVLTPHGGFNPEWSIFSPFQQLIKKTYHQSLGKWLINYAVDGIRAVSEWEKEEMIKSGLDPKKITVIANGLEDEAFADVDKLASTKIRAAAKSYGRYIFGNARIYEIKNQETIIRALPLLPNDIKFVNIGTIGSTVGNHLSNDSYLKKLQELAADLGVSDRVIFPGIVKGVDKYYLFKHAVCFVHMAIWESFCNVVSEAISQCQVCVVANNTALPYLVKNGLNGYLIDTYDHKLLAEKINSILDLKNKREIEKIKNYNLTFGHENSWQNVAERMEKLYLSLVQNYET